MDINLLDEEIDSQDENSVHKVYLEEDTNILDYPIDENVEVVTIHHICDVYDDSFTESKIQIGDDITNKKRKPLYKVYVGTKERGYELHIHVLEARNGYKWELSICIMLLHNAYFDHGNHTSFINDRDNFNLLKAELLKSDDQGITNWLRAVYAWNRLNPNYQILDIPKPTQYDFDTILTYAEYKKQERRK